MKPTKSRRGSRASAKPARKPHAGKPPRSTAPPRPVREAAMVEDAKGPRKLIEFDASTLQALELLGRDSMRDLQELADEAFRDLLKKHGRPYGLKEALRQSTRQMPANDEAAGRLRKMK
jgi:hypothetical protein